MHGSTTSSTATMAMLREMIAPIDPEAMLLDCSALRVIVDAFRQHTAHDVTWTVTQTGATPSRYGYPLGYRVVVVSCAHV